MSSQIFKEVTFDEKIIWFTPLCNVTLAYWTLHLWRFCKCDKTHVWLYESCHDSWTTCLQFFLHCHNFITPRTNLMNELGKHDSNILNLDEISLTKLFLYGDSKYENNVNKKILLASANFILSKGQPFFLNICLLAIFLSFCLCIFYDFVFYPSLHGHSKVMRSCF